MVQNFVVFVDGAATAKIKTTKLSSGGLGGGKSTKICTSENIPLYGILIKYAHNNYCLH